MGGRALTLWLNSVGGLSRRTRSLAAFSSSAAAAGRPYGCFAMTRKGSSWRRKGYPLGNSAGGRPARGMGRFLNRIKRRFSWRPAIPPCAGLLLGGRSSLVLRILFNYRWRLSMISSH
jgi:hypothetical protein